MKKIIVCLLVLSVFLSINTVVAFDGDLNNVSHDEVLNSEDTEIIESSSFDDNLGSEELQNVEYDVNQENSRVIYVGQNTTEDGGNGSYKNPFSTLQFACNNVSGEDKVTVNIFNGTYYIGSHLKFDTNNLFINGLGNVIIKNQFNNIKCGNQAFGLKSSSANFTMHNIIFDASEWTQLPNLNIFTPFIGTANYGTYVNCTFTGFKTSRLAGANEFNANFINCVFEGFKHMRMFNNWANGNKIIYFENCIFLNNTLTFNIFSTIFTDKNVSMNGVWFGQNEIPDYVISLSTVKPDGQSEITGTAAPPRDIPITKYAIFSVSENYLGKNQFEIIGKLCWNGTDESVGDSFAPMTVTLSSKTGEIDSTTTLKNGIFRTIYNSTSSENSIKVTLDEEEIELDFNVIDIQVDAPSIFSGDEQNITVTLPQSMNAIVNITVNNKTYKLEVKDSDSINYTIDDVILTEGKYDVNVILSDLKNHIYGSNSTELNVSKISQYDFNVIAPSEVGQGSKANFSIELPDDASGIITISMDDNYSKSYSVNGSFDVEVPISNIGDNKIIVNYSGDNRYVPDFKEVHINAYDRIPTIKIIIPSDVKVGDPVNIGFILPNDATGIIYVSVGETKYWEKLTQGKANIKVPIIYTNSTVKAEYLGDNKYDGNTNSSELIVNKLSPNMQVQTSDAVYGNDATVAINLPDDATGNIKIFIEDILIAESSIINGQSVISINDLPIGDYNITVSYSGDNKYQKSSNNCDLSILRIFPYLHIENVDDIYVGESAVIKVNVTDEIADKVTLTVDGDNVQYQITDNGIIANINKLNAGNHTVHVTFEGDDEYCAIDDILSFNVFKIKDYIANLRIDNANIEKTKIEIELPQNATGNITFTIDDIQSNSIFISDVIILEKLTSGKHNISAIYSGDGKYEKYEFNIVNFDVNKLYEIPKVTIQEYNTYGNKTIMIIDLPSDATGNVTIILDEIVLKEASLINGTLSVILPEDLAVGIHSIAVTYVGDVKYDESSVNTSVNVIKAQPSIHVDNLTSVVGETITLNIRLPTDATGIVLITINGTNYFADIKKGIANLSISNLKQGNYLINVEYLGNNNYNNISTVASINVDDKKESILNIDLQNPIKVNESNVVSLDLPLDAQGNVTLKVDGKILSLDSVVNGNVNLSFGNLSSGNHFIEIIYSGDDKYASNSSSFIYSFEKNDLIIIIDGIEYPVNVVNGTVNIETNKTENPKTVVIDGIEYSVSVINGTAIIQTNKTLISSTVVVDGVEYPINLVNGTVNIKTNITKPIAKKDTVIVVDTAFTRVANDYNAGERGGMFYATLKDSDGNVLVNKTVQIALNGKIYNVTSDDQGRAGLQVNLANANTYTYAISFQGDDQYNGAPIASSKLTVTKKKTTIKASNKVFNAKTKTKKISVTLKTVKNKYDNKTYLKSGKKVTLKVNGKTYTAKINKKGVAKFTIKITKKGKYTAKLFISYIHNIWYRWCVCK